MISVACEHCQKKYQLDRKLVGKKVRCKACQEAFVVAAPEDADEFDTDFDDFDDDDEEEDAPPSPRTQKPARGGSPPAKKGLVPCPMCGRNVSPNAASCPGCGEELAGTSGNTGKGKLWRDGKLLVMKQNAKLPARCVKTNEPCERYLKRTMYWHPAWVYILLVQLLIYAIVALIIRKKAVVEVGLSDDGFRRRSYGMIIAGVSVGLAIGMFFLGIASLDSRPPSQLWIFIPLSFLVGIVGLVVGSNMSSVVTPARITDDYVWIKGVCPAYLDELPEWDGED